MDGQRGVKLGKKTFTLLLSCLLIHLCQLSLSLSQSYTASRLPAGIVFFSGQLPSRQLSSKPATKQNQSDDGPWDCCNDSIQVADLLYGGD